MSAADLDALIEKYAHLPTWEMVEAIKKQRPTVTIPEIVAACDRLAERAAREAEALCSYAASRRKH